MAYAPSGSNRNRRRRRKKRRRRKTKRRRHISGLYIMWYHFRSNLRRLQDTLLVLLIVGNLKAQRW
jgi:hypothetical protein